MNRKFIIGGIVFWAGLSGCMGLKILESYTEDAVFAALAAVPAQAEQIRYSFLDGTLSLKNVEYEIPDGRSRHKGTVESVEVRGFNRKVIFVKPDMPAYDPDALPLVAESVEVSGIRDSRHEGRERIDQEVSFVHVKGWRQRLGLLLDKYHRNGTKAPFYEELYRCAVDEFSADGLEAKAVFSSDPDPLEYRIGHVEAVGGIQPPRGAEKVHPVTVAALNMGFRSGPVRGTIGSIKMRGIAWPDPECMEEFAALGTKASEIDDPSDVLDKISGAFSRAYGKRPPFEHFGLKALNVKTGGADAEPVEAGEIGVSLGCSDKGVKTSLEFSDLKFRTSSFGGLAGVVWRKHPEGVSFSMKSDLLAGPRVLESSLHCLAQGAGTLDAGFSVEGDMTRLKDSLLSGDFDAVLSSDILKCVVRSLVLRYSDSGLAALLFEAVAGEAGERPESLLDEAKSYASSLKGKGNPLLARLGSVLEEQLDRPGSIEFSFAPEKPVKVQDLTVQFFLQPSRIPVSLKSSPGASPMAFGTD